MLVIPAYITARASRTCHDACRDQYLDQPITQPVILPVIGRSLYFTDSFTATRSGLWSSLGEQGVYFHNDVIKWKHFPRYYLYGEFTGNRRIPRTKATDVELWCVFILAWINGWVNNGEAGDLRHHRTHYDVTVIRQMTVRYWWFTIRMAHYTVWSIG